MKFALFCVVIVFPSMIEAQTISTFAGTGVSGSTGDGGPATAARFVSPNDGMFDVHGNFYFTDNASNKVRKIDTSGIVTTVAGTGTGGFSGDGGPATSANLYHPPSVKVDSAGNIYIADGQNYRVRKVDHLTGYISTIAGTGSATFSGDGGNATAAGIQPNDICFDRLGNMYISDGNNHRVRKVSTSGIITTIAGTGATGYSGDGGAATSASITSYRLCFDAIGNLYISDNSVGECRIAKLDTFGIITTIAGTDTGYHYNGDGIPATSANIAPLNVYVNSIGELFLCDYPNYRIRKIDGSGIIHTIAGNGTAGFSGDGGPATAAQLYGPSGLAFDGCGNMFFPDLNNHRIRKVTAPHTPIPFSITSNTNDTLCTGMPVNYTAHTTATGTLAYQWQVNGTNVGSGATSYTYNPTNGDSVKCILVNATPCYIDTVSSNTIHVVTNTLGISLTGPHTAPMGSTVTINAAVTGADSAYNILWYNKGALFSTTTAPVVNYTKTMAVDSITAKIVSTSQSCNASAVSGVWVVDSGITAVTQVASSLAMTEVLLWPNPVSDVLFIDARASIGSVIIMDILGRKIVDLNSSEKKVSVPMGQLPTGVYFVKVTCPAASGRSVFVARIVKE